MESVRNETKIIQTTENLETIKVEKLRKWALLGHKARNKASASKCYKLREKFKKKKKMSRVYKMRYRS